MERVCPTIDVTLWQVDYSFYIEKLKLACDKHRCSVHAYVIMINHVHLIITPHLEQSLGKAMDLRILHPMAGSNDSNGTQCWRSLVETIGQQLAVNVR
jgi:hypothetical protein